YLVLLSLYQTCVYKGASFYRFLLSGEQDVDAFIESTRRRRAAVRPRKPARQPPPEVGTAVSTATAESGGGGLAVVGSGVAEATGGGQRRGVAAIPGSRWEAMAAVEEIVRKVAAGEEDPRLQWSRGDRRVRVLFNRAFPDRAVRGPWLYQTLEA